MILITSSVTIAAEHYGEAIAFAKRHVDASRLEAGCLAHQYFEDPENSHTLVFLESWKDQAAIDFHFAQSYSRDFAKAISAWAEGRVGLEIHEVSETRRVEF